MTQSFKPATAEAQRLSAPAAKQIPVETTLHGDTRLDNYTWLRQKDNPEVLAYLNAENAYSDEILRPTEVFQEKLYQEMLSRIQQTDLSVPYTLRGFQYFTRTEEGKQYPIHLRAKANPADPESLVSELLLDLNALAEGHCFLGLGAFEISDNNQLLAYSSDVTGFRQYTLEIKNLATGGVLPFKAERVTSAAWSADNKSLFYTIEDAISKRSYRLYRHILGSKEPDALLFEETDERFRIDIERSRSGDYLFLLTNSHTTSEIRFLRANDPFGELKVIAPRENNHEYYADHHPDFPGQGDSFLIRTNSLGRTFRLVFAPAADPQCKNWRELIPNRPNVMLSGFAAFRTHFAIYEREGGLPYLRIAPLHQGASNLLDPSYRIPFSEPAYNASLGTNPEFDQSYLRYEYQSFITPRSIFDYNVATRESILRKQQPVLGAYDPSLYVSQRLHATASDGTQIPISLVARRSTPLDGSAPLLLYGYGSYGISMPVGFNSNRLSLLDRGAIFAIAHIRGGGELGKPWHDAGRMRNKRNTFTDFISAAEFLIGQNFTNANKLAIEGGSAGGLLLGAAINMRPDLFRIVISHVPFVDVLNTMLDASLPLTVGEYEEWGNPQIADDYFYMKSYCPYTNLAATNYPSILVKTGLNDSQVMYWEPAKYVAKLRTLKRDDNVLLFKINMGAGHGGASGRYDYLREIALDYAFLLTQLGIRE